MQIESAVNFLTEFNQNLDQAFSSLAISLPEMSDQVDRLIDTLDDLQSSDGKNLLAQNYARIDVLSKKMRSFLSDNISALQEIIQNVEETEVHIEKLTQHLSQIEDLASETKLISLNAAIASERLGAQGRAFGVITQYLTKVSQQGDETAIHFLSKTEAILTNFQTLKQLSTTLNQSLDQLIQTAREKIDPATKSVLSLLEELSGEQSEVLHQCRDILPAVQEVMLLIQNQDVLRQGIEHISIVLNEIQEVQVDGNASDTEMDDLQTIHKAQQELDFQVKAAELSSNLYRDNSKELEDFFIEVDAKLTRVNHVADALVAMDERLSAKGDFGQRISAPMDHFHSVFAESGEILNSYKEFDIVCSGLQETLNTLTDDLGKFRGFFKSMNRIRLLMKIEAGSVPALTQDAQPITQSIQKIENELKALLKSTETICRNLDRQRDQCTDILKHVIEFLPVQSVELKREFDSVNGQLDESKDSFKDNTIKAIGIGRAIENSVQEFQSFLPRLQAAFMEDNIIQTTCQSITDSAKQDQMELERESGLVYQDDQMTDHFLDLITRFTTLSHKEIVGAITGIDIEVGDSGGELTLF